MASMRDTIGEKVEKLTAHHSALKERRHGYLVRPLTLIVGWLVVVGGIVTIPAPGPGWVTVFVGVGILSLELRWAQRLLEWGVARYDVFDDWFHRQFPGDAVGPHRPAHRGDLGGVRRDRVGDVVVRAGRVARPGRRAAGPAQVGAAPTAPRQMSATGSCGSNSGGFLT